jgi:hypothetical protein
MKISLLLSGGLRNFEDTYSSFKYYLLDKFDIDVFFYGVENKFGKTKNEIDFKKKFRPVSCVINEKNYYDKIDCKNEYIRSSFYSFYNVYKCNQLKKIWEIENNIKYDLVIRCRLDVFWFRSITEEEIDMATSHILTPKEWNFKSVNQFALSDIFAIGNSEQMDIYCELYNKIDEYCEKIKFHPESLCGIHISKNELSYKEIPRHFIFEYPDANQYQYIPNEFKFVEHFDGQNKNRRQFD